MRKKYAVKIISGKYKGMIGWTPYEKPNKWGNIMFYSNQGSYPYRICVGKEDFEYLEFKEKGMKFREDIDEVFERIEIPE